VQVLTSNAKRVLPYNLQASHPLLVSFAQGFHLYKSQRWKSHACV